ncbi:centrosomal protein of 162 kDa-like [Dreissena polymorpha]|uniref:centrosomal protein of 162 kDa-like n=1 Tax=Dreissena polymorpha TaxID=45954 RepID=UPI0022644DFD|nr:centrosomal protein of 162 kDa-like [Dreissena polymorpha]
MSKKGRSFDDQFEEFLKESLSSEDSVNSALINKYLEPSKKETRPWWDNETGDDDDNDDRNKTSGKNFLKKSGDKFKKTEVTQAPKVKTKKETKPRGKAEASLSKDSLDDISEKSDEDIHGDFRRPQVHLPSDSHDSIDTAELLNDKSSPARIGMDTLDELRDKEQFYRDIENNANGSVDYGRLNQDLSATGHTMTPEGHARNAATLAALRDIEDEEEEHDRPGTQLHSDKEYSEQKPSMLSKVSLLDSLESTMNTTTSPQVGRGTLRDAQDMLEEREEDEWDGYGAGRNRNNNSGPETLKTATGFIGTNTSQEIEALHKALEKVGLSATLGNDSQLLDLSSQTADREREDLVRKLLSTPAGKQRNISEIMKELEDYETKLDKKSQPGHEAAADMEELRGFDLSPAHPSMLEQEVSQRSQSHRSQRGDSSYRGFDTSHTEDTEMYRPVIEVSVKERGRGKKKTEKKVKDDEAKKTRKEKSPRSKKKLNNSTLDRSRSSSPVKIDFSESLKWRIKPVKSSGYGKPFSPPKPPRTRERDILGYSRTQKDRDQSSSPAGTPTGPGSSRPDVKGKGVPSVKSLKGREWSPAEVARQKVKGSQSTQQVRLGTVATNQLEASVESFAQYIKEHFSTTKDVPVPEVKYSADEPSVSASFKEKEAPEEDRVKVIADLKDELARQARSFERQLEQQKLSYEEQIANLNKEIFVLKSKVGDEKGGNDVRQKVLAGQPVEGLTGDQLQGLQRELREQETLISGYQQENKRLYEEIQNLRKQGKQMEERMFRENQKLTSEAANLRALLERKEEELLCRGAITGPGVQERLIAGDREGAITHLEDQLAQSKRTADALSREMNIVHHSKVELEKHIEKLVFEREQLTQALEEGKKLKSEEARSLEKQYAGEIEKLKGKLKWYAENQELLEQGTKKLKARDEEIHKLKMRVEELQTESGKRVEDSKVRARERAADVKKIQDLQRQVKEMEAILKKRNPNSLPSLMMAAAAAGETTGPAGNSNNRSAYTEVLESRVAKLEKELEGKDAETDQLVRSVEQKYHSIKCQFEERIQELEHQLSMYQGETEHAHPHTNAMALERELEGVRERYKQTVKQLQAEVDRLTAEVEKAKKMEEKTASQISKESESELRVLVKSLQLEVESKNHDMQVLQKSLERLRKEKQMSFTREVGKPGRGRGKGGKQTDDEIEFASLPTQPTASEKTYDAKVFEDVHISDVIKENDDLKMKVDRQHLQLGQQRVEMRKVVAENEALLRQTREAFDEKLEQMKAAHEQEVSRLLAQNALEHSTSRLAELQTRVQTQEVMIKHLREQQARLEVEAEAAAVLRVKQTRLEETLKSLHRELKEAKKSHTPEMRHFESLQEKIIQIETKHSQREKELQDIIRNSRQAAAIETEKEVERWRQLVESKNNEIQQFRIELDSILEVLRVLQKQGVVLPVNSAVIS